MSMQVPKNGFTHGGKFHADDVFSTALLRILRPDFTVTRGFSVPENFDGIVYDIGNGPFDHHAADRPSAPTGCQTRPSVCCGGSSAHSWWGKIRPACWTRTLCSRWI